MLPAAGSPASRVVDWQLAAVVAAALRPFTVLTGGPGTGKTATVARILAVLHRLSPGLRVALCAPTGKAAARLAAAVAERSAGLPVPAGLAATTLHRLLHYIGDTDSFRAGPDRLLPYDCVVVDEASMLDPAVLAVLLSSLPAAARLLPVVSCVLPWLLPSAAGRRRCRCRG